MHKFNKDQGFSLSDNLYIKKKKIFSHFGKDLQYHDCGYILLIVCEGRIGQIRNVTEEFQTAIFPTSSEKHQNIRRMKNSTAETRNKIQV